MVDAFNSSTPIGHLKDNEEFIFSELIFSLTIDDGAIAAFDVHATAV